MATGAAFLSVAMSEESMAHVDRRTDVNTANYNFVSFPVLGLVFYEKK